MRVGITVGAPSTSISVTLDNSICDFQSRSRGKGVKMPGILDERRVQRYTEMTTSSSYYARRENCLRVSGGVRIGGGQGLLSK